MIKSTNILYQAPIVEVLDVHIEQGFAQSIPGMEEQPIFP